MKYKLGDIVKVFVSSRNKTCKGKIVSAWLREDNDDTTVNYEVKLKRGRGYELITYCTSESNVHDVQ